MNRKIVLSLFLLCMSFAFVHADSFTIKYNGEVLKGANNVINVTEVKEEFGEEIMKAPFELEVTGAPESMYLDWTLDGILAGTLNQFCWDVCFTPAEVEDGFREIEYKEVGIHTEAPYASYYPSGIVGTSTVVYKFSSSKASDGEVTVTINFIYEGNKEPNKFAIKYNNEVLTGSDNVIDITETEKSEGNDIMKVQFDMEVTGVPQSVFLNWNLEGALTGTANDFYWDRLITPADESESSYEMKYTDADVSTDHPYATYYPNGVIGTSTIVYQFSSDNEAEAPVAITVNFRYNGNGTGISSGSQTQDFSISQVPGSNRFDILSDKKLNKVCIYDLSGNRIELLHGEETGRELQKGCYLLVLTDEQGVSVTHKGIIR